jgi:hypothetical protein
VLRVCVVDVSALESGFRGQLTSIGPSGDRASREVFGDSCAEVVGALGLVLALAVDPGAATAPLAPEPAEPPAAAPPPASSQLTNPPSADAPPNIPAPEPGSKSAFARPHFGAGGGIVSTGGVAPAPMTGGALFVEATFGERGVFRPTARLGAQRASTGTIDVPSGGAARLTWTVGTLDACPVRWARNGLAVTPCARVDAGVIAGSGAKIAHPQDDSRFWLDAGAVARGEWTFASPFFVDVEAGIFVPITRPRFHFDAPDVTIHEPAPVGGALAAHVGGRFP